MQTPTPADFGYVQREPALSRAEAISKNPLGQERLIGKSALQQYIASFLDENGRNRQLTEAVCPSVANFVTKYSYEDDDQEKRRVQLRRIYEEQAREIPAIILIDSGSTTIPSGIGGFVRTKSHVSSRRTELQINRIDRVAIDIVIIADDENTATNLGGVLALIFSPGMRFLGGGNYITSSDPSHRWVATLPLAEPSFGATNRQPVQEDQQNSVHTTQTSIEVTVETFGLLTYQIRDPLQDSILIPTADAGPNGIYPVRINIPEQARIGVPLEFTIINDEPGNQLVLDDPKLATVEYSYGHMILNPKRFGVVTLKLIRKHGGEVLTEQAVTIVQR